MTWPCRSTVHCRRPARAGTYLARRAAKAFDRLLTGDLEPAEYRALMAAVAAQDAVARPLRVPG